MNTPKPDGGEASNVLPHPTTMPQQIAESSSEQGGATEHSDAQQLLSGMKRERKLPSATERLEFYLDFKRTLDYASKQAIDPQSCEKRAAGRNMLSQLNALIESTAFLHSESNIRHKQELEERVQQAAALAVQAAYRHRDIGEKGPASSPASLS